MKLSGSIVALWFGWIAPAYGYNSALDIQPDTVAMGFRIFMTVPVIVSSILAIIALFFYPLHGEKLKAVKEALAARKKSNPKPE
jgi:GPH family glycoside/pentoside/hexuronide:cation symporter